MIQDKGWRDTFFSCFSFLKQIYSFSDILVFGGVNNPIFQVWGLEEKELKILLVENLEKAVEVIRENVGQEIGVYGFVVHVKG